jgi:dipeptidyl aminopeptidase/acylaminoacyl peptidase
MILRTAARRFLSLAAPLALVAAPLFAQDPTITPPPSSASVPASSGAPDAQAKAPANPKARALLADLGRVRNFSSVALSPDGTRVAWAVSGQGRGSSEVYLAGADGQHAQQIALAGAQQQRCYAGSLAWSSDGKQLALLSNCANPDQAEIFLLDTANPTTPARQLTHLHGAATSLAWSPDGRQIGFLYVPGATRPAGALAAMKPPSGVIGVEGLEIQHVAAADASSGDVRLLTPDALHAYEFNWSPDGREVAYVAAPPPGENNWWVAQLYTQQAEAGAQPRSILDPQKVSGPLHGLQIAVPRWSPDGREIAFIGGLMSDQGATGGDIYRIPAAGGEPEDITPGIPVTPTWIDWTGPRTLLVSEIADGASRVTEMQVPASGTVTNAAESPRLLEVPGGIGGAGLEMALALSKDGRTAAYTSSSYTSAPEVYTARLAPNNQPRQITHINDALKPAWGKAESVTWENEGFRVQGWLQFPAGYDASKRYPMIVMVHGGPSSAVVPRWPGVGFGGAPFSAMGYFVLYPNPRGSYGEGEKFTQANVKDFGYGDLRDILAGVDTVEKKYPVDDNRLGLTGWSYGGFMTMFGVTQTNRFHAAVAGAGISDWQSYYGENSIDQWMIPFFGASVYDDPAVYAKSSAIDYIKKVKTPTLIVVGDRDGECPAPQSFEFWHALRAEGVPTELVVYPDEGHGFRSPEHRRDVLERALAWFGQYLPAGQ